MTEPTQGVQFPLVEGRRSSLGAGREVFAQAAAAVDAGIADAVRAERDWRSAYPRHLRALTAAAAADAEATRRMAQDGLAAVYDRFVLARDDQAMPLTQAMKEWTEPRFDTVEVVGTGERAHALEIPYRGEVLRGDALRRRLEAWVRDGIVEPSAADAVGRVLDNPDWLDLSDRWIALLGAASEMGPLRPLASWGANLLAVDLPSAAVWQRILPIARAGAGRVHVPVRDRVRADGDRLAEVAGADLLVETPEIRTWLTAFEVPMTVGNYAYADGAAFVRLAVAVDAITDEVLRRLDGASVSYLATPTDVFAVPPEAATAARARYAGRGWRAPVQSPVRLASGRRLFVPNYGDAGDRPPVVDVLIPQQGPNYALAKWVQRWRATSARDAGVLTSANVAPATHTRSVVRNRVLRAAYAGAHRFGVEVFAPETSQALMAALLVHDLRNPAAAARPGTALAHPYRLFMDTAAHGGLWRVAYEPRSVLPLAVLAGARHLL